MKHLKLFENIDEDLDDVRSLFLDIKDEFDIEETDRNFSSLNDAGLYYKIVKVGGIIYIFILANDPINFENLGKGRKIGDEDDECRYLNKYLERVLPALKSFATRLRSMGYVILYNIDAPLEEFNYDGYFTIEIHSIKS